MKVNKQLLPLNLQLFAGEGEQDADQEKENLENPPTGDKSFDDILKDKTIQSEFDKRVSKALETAKGKWDKEVQTKIDLAKTEAEKLATMNAEQKADYEKQQKEDALIKRESEITKRELRATALETLAEKGLPRQLAEILSFENADATIASIDAVEKAFSEAVEIGVTERLKGKPPGTGNAAGQKAGDFGKQLAEQLNKGNEGLEKAKESYFK